MRAFKLLKATYALEDIQRCRLKVSEFDDMNDPFELYGARWDHAEVDELFHNYARSKGCLCFSRNWSNPLLWSHYAEKHKGICLGFEIPDDEEIVIVPKYVSTRESLPADAIRNALQTGDRTAIVDAIMRKFEIKFDGWKYEDEVRMLCPLDGKPEQMTYFSFGPQLKLVEVIAGARCVVPKNEIELALGDYSQGVGIIKATVSSDSFCIISDPKGFNS